MELQLKNLNKENIDQQSSTIFQPSDSNLTAYNKQTFSKTQQSLTNRKPILRPSDSILYSETYQGHTYESTLNRELDPRDELIRIPINFPIPLLEESKKKWSQTKRGESEQGQGKQLIQFKSRLADWLITIVDVVTSVAFNHLRKDNLTDGQAKAFSAKNILGNVKQLFLACKSFSEDNRVKLCQFIDNQLCGAFGAIITRYPQTSSKGASQRVRKSIKHINNRASDQFDFLNMHNLNLKFKEDGDYSSEILQVFNKVITISGQNSDIDSESTFFEQYKQFCQRLTELVPEGQVKYAEYLPKRGIISNVVNRIPCSPERMMNQKVQSEKDIFFSHLARKIINDSVNQDFTWQPEKISKGKLKIAQKIPSWVPIFSEDDIHLGRFKARHPSVLRVLNKWTEELLEQIQNSQQQIGSKINKFKTSQGQLIFLTAEEREALATAAKLKLGELKQQLSQLKEQNKLMQSRFACEYSAGKYINRDIDVGVFAAKLSQLVSQYVFQFANKAIHLLMKCVRDAQSSWKDLHTSTLSQHTQSDQEAKVDLVTFKIGDLFRGKYQCRQSQFISLLELLYTLDKQFPSDFKLIRIKNRLDQKDNDLLINYLFKGKIICQLQLSILAEQSKKEGQYSSFNHFLYEIKRAQFGPLSELACISAQYDPVIASFAVKTTFAPQLKFANLSKSSSDNSSGKIALKGPFLCGICEQLKQVFNPQFFERSQDEVNICNQCLQQMLLNDSVRRTSFLRSGLKQGSQVEYFSTRVVPYFPIGQTVEQISRNFITRGLYVPLHRKKPKVHFFRSVISLNDNRLIFSTLDPSGEIKNFEKIDFSGKDLQQLEKYVFFDFPEEDCSTWQKICFDWKDNTKNASLSGLQILNKQNLQLVIKTLKSSEEVLYLSGREGIIQLSQNYMECKDRRISKERKDLFLSLIDHIKYVELQKCGITEINTFSLSKFKSVIEMNLSYNKISSLSNYSLLKDLKVGRFFTNLIESNKALQSFPYLRKLNLSHNVLKSLAGLQNLKQISILDLSGNQISSVSEIQQLVNLEWLSLKNNKIQDFPKLSLPYITTLDLSQNLIKVIRSNKMPKLKILNLRENLIKKIQNIYNSPELQDLSLNHNRIHKIQGLQQKLQLKSLNLSKNNIQILQNLHYLQSLQTLWLDRNQLEDISHLNNLPKLTRVDLSYNKIKDINSLTRKQQIKYINLKGNPMTQQQLKHEQQQSNFKLIKVSKNHQNYQI